MAADLDSLRSTIELMAEQVSQLVALGSQQIEAVARLAPLVAQSADSISGGLRDVVGAVQAIPGASSPAAQTTTAEEQPMPSPGTRKEQDPALSAAPRLLAAGKRPKSVRQRRPRTRQDKAVHTVASAGVAVKSIPDAQRSDRFYTSIRLPRAVWDEAGFGPEDRLLLAWTGKMLTIDRVAEGGVKPKAIGEISVVLQSWKLGNLNFDQLKVTGANASLRLAAEKNSKKA